MSLTPLPDRPLGERAKALAAEVDQMERDLREARASLVRLAARAGVPIETARDMATLRLEVEIGFKIGGAT